MRPRIIFILLVLWLTPSLASLVHSAPLVVGPGETVKLGDTNQPITVGYDSLIIDTGGNLELLGDLTITVEGDITINGDILFQPKDSASKGNDGVDGTDGPDNQPTGQNAGTGGTAARQAPNWTSRGPPKLELNSRGTVIISGQIRLNPKFDGGAGGRGGHGGNGGSGVSGNAGAGGGFAGQAGEGGYGGHAGLEGPALRIGGKRIELRPGSLISLDNLGKGGDGGVGGNGGNGGRGGDSTGGSRGGAGGGGGPAGPGGQGGQGGNGGVLQLTADTIVLEGDISLKGGPGGNGSKAGTPGNGGVGGNAVGAGSPGGSGGHAGNTGGSGPRGGKGGQGGNGGTLIVQAKQGLSYFSEANLSGGKGGTNGTGQAAALAKGGAGGSGDPNGAKGGDSGRLDDGAPGAAGKDGNSEISTGFSPGPLWVFTGPTACLSPFVITNADFTTRSGVKLCGGNCLSTFVNTDSEFPFELRFEYRWLSTVGTLEFHLADRLIHRLDAPAILNGEFQQASVILSDPALRSPILQQLEVCVTPEGPAEVQLANLLFRTAPEANTPPPVVSIRFLPGESKVEIDWASVAGQTYQLQIRTSLTQGAWSDLGPPMPGTGSTLTVSPALAAGQPQAFYRVLVSPSP